MLRQSVNSSNIESIGFDTSTKMLEIEFNSGAIYQYYNVPDDIYHSLMSANSHGEYLNDHIKDNYRFSRIN